MKKLAFMFVAVVAMSFASCGGNKAEQPVEEAVDSTEVIDSAATDTAAVDSAATDSAATDSVVAE